MVFALFSKCFGSSSVRPPGLGAGGQGGRPAGAPARGPEDLREEEETPQTAHVPQDVDEDHRSEKHQRQRSEVQQDSTRCTHARSC